MNSEQATSFCQTGSYLLGELLDIKQTIREANGKDEHYTDLVEQAFQVIRDLVLETHARFCSDQ